MPMRSMTVRSKVLSMVAMVALLTILLAGCKKNTTIDLNPNLNAANDNVILHRAFIHVFDMMLKASLDSALHVDLHALIDSATVTYNPQTDSYLFSYQGNKCSDSVTRYGNFEVAPDTLFFLAGSKAPVHFTSYFEDGHHINADDTLCNQGLISGGKIHFQSVITDALIAKDSIGNITWNGSINHFVDANIVSQGIAGAVVLVDGSGSGTTSRGYGFSSEIQQPINDKLACPWLRSGIIGLTLFGTEVERGTISYRSETACNDSVRYDFDGTIYKWRMDRDHLAK